MELQVQKLFKSLPKQDAIIHLKELGVDYHEETHPKTREVFAHLGYGIMANRESEVVRECRGLGLHVDTWEIFRMGFRRFLNYHENHCDPIDLSNKEVFYLTKEDGSLIFLHCHNGEWLAGTRGRLFPDQNVHGYGMTFVELFWNTFEENGGRRENLDPNLCYLFELCAPENRVVIFHPARKVVIIGARQRLDNWAEFHPEKLPGIAKEIGTNHVVEAHPFPSIGDCLLQLKKMDGTQSEGFVLVQWNEEADLFFRAKMKSEEYLILHRIVSAKSLGNLVRLVLENKRNVLKDFPEYFNAYDLIADKISKFQAGALATYEEHKWILEDPDKSIGDFRARKKKFAAKVVPTEFAPICFALADGKMDEELEGWRKGQNTRPGIKRFIEKFNLASLVGESWNVYDEIDEDI